MTVTSNSVYFTVRVPGELPGSGWHVRVLEAPAYTTEIIHIYEFMDLTVGPALNRPGEGSITLDLDSELWDTILPGGQRASYLLDREHVWRCYQDGVLRFEFLGATIEEATVDPSATRTVTVSGPGTAEVLRWAKVFPPGFPVPPGETGFLWPFVGKPVMQAYLYLMHAAQARGAIPWVQARFGKEADAGGTDWDDLHTSAANRVEFLPELGTDLLTLIDEVTGQDPSKPAGTRADWRMRQGFKLEVRKVIGVDRSKEIIFYEPAIESKRRTRAREELINYVVVSDTGFNTSYASDSASIATWGRRELWDNRGNLTEPKMRVPVVANLLEKGKIERSNWILTVPYDEPKHVPFVDYTMGDWVGVMRYHPQMVSRLESYRVIGIVVHVPDTGDPTVELELQSRLDSKLRQLELDLTAILNRLLNAVIPPGPPENVIGDLPDYKTVPCWDFKGKKWKTCSVVSTVPEQTPVEPPDNVSGGRPRVFISTTDPTLNSALTVSPGDFWVELE